MAAQINATDRRVRMDLYLIMGLGLGGPGPHNFMIGGATAPTVPTPLVIQINEGNIWPLYKFKCQSRRKWSAGRTLARPLFTRNKIKK